MTNLMNLPRRVGAAAMTNLVDLSRRFTWVLAALALIVAMGGTWMTSATATAAPGDSLARRPTTAAPAAGTGNPAGARGTNARAAGAKGRPASAVPSQTFHPGGDDEPPPRKTKALAGTLNLNTATEEQLMLLPQVGPAKAERIVTWRRKNGGFKRTADLRRVKGFGYKTFKRLEPLLDVRGETTLAPK